MLLCGCFGRPVGSADPGASDVATSSDDRPSTLPQDVEAPGSSGNSRPRRVHFMASARSLLTRLAPKPAAVEESQTRRKGRLLAKLYAYMRKHEKGFEGCIEGLALLIGADGQSPTKEDAFMHLAEALEEQNPDMEAVEELLGFYAADDDEGVSRVDINGLIHGLQRVQLARGARNGSQKVPDPLPPPEEELEHVKITGEAKNRILAIVATQVRQQPENAARTSEGPDANMDPQTVVATLMQAEAIDLNALTVPTGTSVQYIDADEEDPASIRVPVWSLRAMALKTKRVEADMSSEVIRKLGVQGAPLYDKMVAQRSASQQDAIVASALVMQARGQDAKALIQPQTISRNPTLHKNMSLGSMRTNSNKSGVGPEAGAQHNLPSSQRVGTSVEALPGRLSIPPVVATDAAAADGKAAARLSTEKSFAMDEFLRPA